MRRRSFGFLLLVLLCAPSSPVFGQAGSTASAPPAVRRPAETAFRVLSWNVSGGDFTKHSAEGRKILRLLDPDILLLDEVEGGRTTEQIAAIVRGLRGANDNRWHMVIGGGGGRQRGVILSRHPVSAVPAFAFLRYPESSLTKLRPLMDDATWTAMKPTFDAGIAVAAGIVELGRRRVLAVAVDLQSGAGMPDWQEARRLIEIDEIRTALQQTLKSARVDGVLLAGDFNSVSTVMPLVRITNPYPEPHVALVPAQAMHLDGLEWWTWDGRGTPFPTQALDFSLYSPDTLTPINALAFSTEDLSPDALAAAALQTGTSRRVSDHLPIVVDYRWRK
jgi:endonuclease/exonuclease/phosphatase family metal-dependent hydrolase